MTPSRTLHVLIAEDDEEDQLLVRDAFAETQLTAELTMVPNGEELLNCLYGRGQYKGTPEPDLILLDLNMPRMDGREALAAIKACPQLRHIPVVVMTTSSATEDIMESYHLGGNSFIRKPLTYRNLKSVVKTLAQYWAHTVELPSTPAGKTGRVPGRHLERTDENK